MSPQNIVITYEGNVKMVDFTTGHFCKSLWDR